MARRIRRWLDRLLDRRGCPRVVTPLVAHYWPGGTPEGHKLKNISATGACILTSENWYPGTILSMTFQYHRHDPEGREAGDPNLALSLHAKVVWSGRDGVGVQFVNLSGQDRKRLEKLMVS